ncbi:hypothetical protein [Paludibaculum fermentans]|uniref:Uncharacterized protein n=1 Tax=Paludibaculum fermentans TaxID=1473598 RepID=A0A7S7SK24_PALFE|nr:hypothetical protein [Paludibaculum fermentans]QOY86545.1 hypothetical protein IRI77_27650 [Paludibaculum fermentans]
MKTPTVTRALFALAAALMLCPAGASAAENTVLERYTFSIAQAGAKDQSSGGEVRFRDRFFGNGTATSRLNLLEESSSSDRTNRPLMLSLNVDRQVGEGEIVFALLVFRVEVVGRDLDGNIVFQREFPGFQFGDSASGHWHERMGGLPTNLAQLTVTYFGNYE